MSKARSAGFLCAVLVAQMEYGSRPVIPLRNPPWFTKKPAVHGNPNPSAPLAATVEFATDRPVRARLLLKEGKSERLVASWMSYQKNYWRSQPENPGPPGPPPGINNFKVAFAKGLLFLLSSGALQISTGIAAPEQIEFMQASP